MKNIAYIFCYSHLGNKRQWWLEVRAAKSFERMRNEWQREYPESKFRITDAGRTNEMQEELYRLKPGLAARPGSSWHEAGLATDIDVEYLKKQSGKTQKELEDWIGRFGFYRTVKIENWHFEYHLDIPRRDVKKAIKYIANNKVVEK